MSQPPNEQNPGFFTHLLQSNQYSSSPNQSEFPSPKFPTSILVATVPTYGSKCHCPEHAYQSQLAYHSKSTQYEAPRMFEDFSMPNTGGPARTKNMLTGKWTRMHEYPKWDAAEPIDGDNLQEVFGPDKRERPAGKQRAVKKQKSVETSGSTGGSQSESVSSLVSQDYRRKCDAAERAYEA
ncbi:hypothetical protein Tco_0489887 [Tanacetum coccineum]